MDAFPLIFAGGLVVLLLEKLFPNYVLPQKDGWIFRAILFNSIQVVLAIIGRYTWEHVIIMSGLNGHSMYNFGKTLSTFQGALIGYFVNTWIFYWWHRIRHENKTIWNWIHQLHHSPERIEIITAFYKHPFEIIVNSIIMTIIAYPILGLSDEASALTAVILAYFEFFYHMNIATPHFIGYFIQRPESHCLHHERDRRFCKNYSDLPLWDILGGTFENPTKKYFEIGFSNDNEKRIGEMILCKDVLKKNKERPMSNKNKFLTFMVTLALVVGCLSTIGYINKCDNLRGIAFATASSPLPLVFSAFNGVETFSTTFEFDLTFENTTRLRKQLDHKLYGMLKGPYNRRNVYGAIFSHGPFFDKPNMIKIRQQILYWGMCHPGQLATEFGINDKLKQVDIIVKSQTVGNENQSWIMSVTC